MGSVTQSMTHPSRASRCFQVKLLLVHGANPLRLDNSEPCAFSAVGYACYSASRTATERDLQKCMALIKSAAKEFTQAGVAKCSCAHNFHNFHLDFLPALETAESNEDGTLAEAIFARDPDVIVSLQQNHRKRHIPYVHHA